MGSNLSRLAPLDMIDLTRSGSVLIGLTLMAVMSMGYIDGKVSHTTSRILIHDGYLP